MRHDVKAVLRLVDQRLDVLSSVLRGRKTADPFGFSLLDGHAQRAARDELAFLKSILLSGSDHASWAMLASIDERVRRLTFSEDNSGTAEVILCALRNLQTEVSRCIAEVRLESNDAEKVYDVDYRVRRLEVLAERRCSRERTQTEPEKARPRTSFKQRIFRAPMFWISALWIVVALLGAAQSAYQNRYELGRALQRTLAGYVGEERLPHKEISQQANPPEVRSEKKSRGEKEAKWKAQRP